MVLVDLGNATSCDIIVTHLTRVLTFTTWCVRVGRYTSFSVIQVMSWGAFNQARVTAWFEWLCSRIKHYYPAQQQGSNLTVCNGSRFAPFFFKKGRSAVSFYRHAAVGWCMASRCVCLCARVATYSNSPKHLPYYIEGTVPHQN